LANLQFSGLSRLGPWATFSVDDAFAAGGLQDNGNVYTRWMDQSPWRQAADSDGQLTLLIADMDLLFDNTGDTFLPTLASWDGAKMVPRGAPDVRTDDGTIVPNIHNDPNAVEGLGAPRELFVEAVPAPTLQSQDTPGFVIRAVAGAGNKVYGLFDDNHTATRTHWEHWNQVGPIQLDANDFITAVSSYDGQIIFAGTNSGRIFWIDPRNGIQAPMDSGNAAQITRILVDASAPPAITGFACAGNTVLQLIGGSTQGPGENGMCLARSTRSTI
jgi:hypothetical protein